MNYKGSLFKFGKMPDYLMCFEIRAEVIRIVSYVGNFLWENCLGVSLVQHCMWGF